MNWSRLGYPVVGNFPVKLKKYKRADFIYCPNNQMTPDYLIKLSQDKVGSKPKEGSMLLVIDECQLLFNAREWQQSGRAKWLSFFTQHRKLGYDIILIAQFDRMVDRQIRSLIEYEYIHRKMSNFGWQGKILSLVFGGKTFIAVKMWYPLHERLGAEVFHARKHIYCVYDTYAAFDGADAAPEPQKKMDAAAPLPAADPAPDSDVKQGEIVDSEPKKKFRIRLPELHLPTPYQGKWLRPGGRSEFGWR